MLVDQIIRNAKIYTADMDMPLASALAVKDGKFVYVGDEAGLGDLEGEVLDLGGKFIMPGIIDSHVHVTFPIGFEYADFGERLECDGKQEALDLMADHIRRNPGQRRYKFMLDKKCLMGEELRKEDLDAICADAELQVQEAEGHSVWVNSKILQRHHITDETRDPVPGLAYYVRDEDGHITGNIFEGAAEMPVILDSAMDLTDDQIDAALQRWIDFCLGCGVTSVFDAGIPGYNAFNERVYQRLLALDKEGRLPVYVDGCYVISAAWEAEEGIEELKRLQREYDSEHLKVHTLKIFQDGTLKIHTAAMVEPYDDIDWCGVTAFSADELAPVIAKLNEEGLDLHLHTVGDRASRVVLDAVELARRELADDYRVRVTCAHLKFQHDADIDRFEKLGVFANYSPWWHCEHIEEMTPLFGEERSSKMYRCKSVWDTGAVVTWSCDNIVFGDFVLWNPFLGMEVGMTRHITEKTDIYDFVRVDVEFPPATEKMGIEEMILGYTINGARQLGIEDAKGSITVGKDADFLVFERDLLTAEHEGFSHNSPTEVYIKGKKA